MECPRDYNCFGCVDRNTSFCPLDDRYFGDNDNFEYEDYLQE